MDISQYCISDDATIFSTMEMIQKNRNRCICVVNENKKFLGVVSQGDILSALIAGVNLYSQVRKIVNGNGVYLTQRDMEQAYRIIRKKYFTIIPVIDENYFLKDVITLDNVFSYIESKYNQQGA